MTQLTRSLVLVSLASIAAFAPAMPAHAGEAPTPVARAHVDLEVDPTAYLLGGFSGHAGVGRGHLRVDLGAFGLDVPSWFHGQEGFDLSFWGAGAKLQWFPLAEQRGLLVDASAAYQRETIARHDTGARAHQDVTGIGVDAGWRFWLPRGFYVTPWAGVSYNVGAHDVMIGGKTFKSGAVGEFAAIHFGYRFR